MKRLLLLLLIPLVAFSQTREQMNLLLLNSGPKAKMITSSVTNGTITASAVVPYNGSKTFTFTPVTAHYALTLLSIDGSPNLDSTSTYTFKNVVAPHTIAATFTHRTFALTVLSYEGSTSPATSIVNEGDTVTFTFTPTTFLDSCVVDGVKTDSTTTYTFKHVAANHSITFHGSIFRFADEFGTDVAAGALNGTYSTSGALRTATDTESKLSITGGILSVSGMASPSEADPLIMWPTVARTAGRMMIGKVGYVSSRVNSFGFNTSTSGSSYQTLLRITGGSMMSASTVVLGANFVSLNKTYYLTNCLRATGGFHFIKGDAYTYNTLMWVSSTGATATLYPSMNTYDGVYTVDFVREPTTKWLPTPIVSDGMGTGSEALGTDVVANGGFADSSHWTFVGGNTTAWSITGGKSHVSQTADGETAYLQNDGPVVAFKTYKMSFDISDFVSSGIWLMKVGNVSSTKQGDWSAGHWDNYIYSAETLGPSLYSYGSGVNNLAVDNVVVKEVTLGQSDGLGHAEGITGGLGAGGSGKAWTARVGTYTVVGGKAIGDTTGTNTGIAIATVDAGTASTLTGASLVRANASVGIVVRYVDATNYIIGRHDGTNAQLVKVTDGVESNLITAAATYVAGATVWIINEGSVFRLYYNNAQVGDEVTETQGLTSTLVGLYNIGDRVNTQDNFQSWARGVGNEYSQLNTWMAP